MFGDPDLPNTEILRRAIEEQPNAQVRRGSSVWALGNVEMFLDDSTYSAALGKIRRRNAERYDEDHRTFTQEPSEEAPFTLVIFDIDLQVCAIAAKSDLGDTAQLGRTLAVLLTSTNTTRARRLRIIASQIKDPREFISLLRRAERITHFEVTFKRPNPIDVEKDFIQPMERLLAESAGDGGKTALSGDDLKKEPLEALSNSAAATGDDAKAKMKLPENDKLVTKRLLSNPATISISEQPSREVRETVALRMKELYRTIRRAPDS